MDKAFQKKGEAGEGGIYMRKNMLFFASSEASEKKDATLFPERLMSLKKKSNVL